MYTRLEARLGGYLFVVYHQTPNDEYFYSLTSLHECIGIAVCPPFGNIPPHEKRYHNEDILVTPGIAADFLLYHTKLGNYAAECVLYRFLHGGLTMLAGTPA